MISYTPSNLWIFRIFTEHLGAGPLITLLLDDLFEKSKWITSLWCQMRNFRYLSPMVRMLGVPVSDVVNVLSHIVSHHVCKCALKYSLRSKIWTSWSCKELKYLSAFVEHTMTSRRCEVTTGDQRINLGTNPLISGGCQKVNPLISGDVDLRCQSTCMYLCSREMPSSIGFFILAIFLTQNWSSTKKMEVIRIFLTLCRPAGPSPLPTGGP